MRNILRRVANSRLSGYTLTEALITSSIIIIIAGLAIPSVRDSSIRQRALISTENLRIIESAKLQFAMDNPGVQTIPDEASLIPYLKYGIPAPSHSDEAYENMLDLTEVTTSSVNGQQSHEPWYFEGDIQTNGFNDLGPDVQPVIVP